MAKPSIPSTASQGGLSELKRRLLFVFLGILVFRLGAHVPIPGIDPQRLSVVFNQSHNSILGMFNMFSGGALLQMTIFALGIMPYISSSIIIQLFTTISPTLEQLKKEGESGKRKINQYTRYGTLVLAIFQGLGLSLYLGSQGAALQAGFTFYFIATITMVTGTMFLMWLGEQMTERGVGNGISLIIFAGIVSRFPAAIGNLLEQFKEGQIQGLFVLIIAAVVILVTAFVVFIERGQRRITVNYAQRQQGRKVYQAQSSHLPLKVNMAGVIPPIFASSILLLPTSLAAWFGKGTNMQWLSDIGLALSYGRPLHMLLLAITVIFFAFFYTALVFNPKDTADNLKRSGGFIPGIRPGEQTARYIDGVMTRLTMAGALYLVLVILLPEFMIKAWNVPFYFGGTSLLIVVVVIMDFMAQVQAHLMAHQYDSLMKKARLKGSNPASRSGFF